MASFAKRTLPENYLYISHLDEDYKYWILPSTPDSVVDSMGSTFGEAQALGRTAPVYTYSSSGPRTVQIGIKLHRELMNDINIQNPSIKLETGEDYVENMIKALQAVVVPKYNATNGAIEVPLVALRLGKQVFIKGIVNNSISLTYEKPILWNDKFAQINISLTITEVDPYDATSIFKNGSFRGVVSSLKHGMNLEQGDS